MNPQDMENEFIRNVYSSRDIRLADQKWLDLWPKVKEDFGLETGMALEISATYRSPKAQHDLFLIGREKPGKIVTHCDGYEKLSLHNIFPSKALDVYIHKGGKTLWDEALFDSLGPLAEKYKIIWGGSWKKFVDRPHLELSS